jgi:curved DNA-binding protein CbpA
MTTANYQKCYSTLGVHQDANWETVRSAYKRQIRRWHPDRYQNPDQRRFAEDMCKEINIAYQLLDDYYRLFGTLPQENESEQNVSTPGGDARHGSTGHTDAKTESYSRADQDRGAASSRSQPAHRSYTSILLAVTVVTAGYLLTDPIFTEETVPGRLEYPESSIGSFETKPRSSSATNSYGETVLEADSVEWQNNLKSTAHKPDPAAATAGLPYITKGSTKHDVLAIQGRPQRETDTAWDYGLSRINFLHGKVVDWYENPMNPLIVRR